jgi:hypothetical protein
MCRVVFPEITTLVPSGKLTSRKTIILNKSPGEPQSPGDTALDRGQHSTDSFHRPINLLFAVLIHMSVKLSPIFGDEHKLGGAENKILKRVSGPNRDEVTGRWE